MAQQQAQQLLAIAAPAAADFAREDEEALAVNEKNGEKKRKRNWASYMPLSQLGVLSLSRPMHIMYSFLSFYIRSPAQRDVAGSFFSNFFFSVFFSFKKIEPARCHRARAMCLS